MRSLGRWENRRHGGLPGAAPADTQSSPAQRTRAASAGPGLHAAPLTRPTCCRVPPCARLAVNGANNGDPNSPTNADGDFVLVVARCAPSFIVMFNDAQVGGWR